MTLYLLQHQRGELLEALAQATLRKTATQAAMDWDLEQCAYFGKLLVINAKLLKNEYVTPEELTEYRGATGQALVI